MRMLKYVGPVLSFTKLRWVYVSDPTKGYTEAYPLGSNMDRIVSPSIHFMPEDVPKHDFSEVYTTSADVKYEGPFRELHGVAFEARPSGPYHVTMVPDAHKKIEVIVPAVDVVTLNGKSFDFRQWGSALL